MAVEQDEQPFTGEPAVVVHGDVEADAPAYARQRLGSVIEHIGEPVLFARVKLTQAADPARERPALAQVVVDVNGDLVRAHVAAHAMPEAIDLLRDRLRVQLQHRHERQRARRRRPVASAPGEWRHGDQPPVRPDHYRRPVEERELVRRKSYLIDELSADEAVFDMEQLDFDFHLFRELATGDDALVERTAEGVHRLTRRHGSLADIGPTAFEITLAEHAAPVLSEEEAVERLGAGGERFCFFANATTGRGNVAYLRYDGHYGLITPE